MSQSKIGDFILKVAEAEMPKVEICGANIDTAGRLPCYFEEGALWSKGAWAAFKEKNGAPNWCGAFASYCYRMGYASAGKDLSALDGRDAKGRAVRWKMSAKASDNQAIFEKLGLFVPAEEVISGAQVRADAARMPGPGDLVIWSVHVGLLRGFEQDEKGVWWMRTLEGNTWIQKEGRKVWGVHNKRYRVTELKKLLGFGLGGSVELTEGRQPNA